VYDHVRRKRTKRGWTYLDDDKNLLKLQGFLVPSQMLLCALEDTTGSSRPWPIKKQKFGQLYHIPGTKPAARRNLETWVKNLRLDLPGRSSATGCTRCASIPLSEI